MTPDTSCKRTRVRGRRSFGPPNSTARARILLENSEIGGLLMADTGRLFDWASRMFSEPDRRQERLRKAKGVEAVCATLAALCAFGAIWGFTSNTTVLGGIRSETVGGVAVLCFSALMFIAAGAGIEQRFVALVEALEKQR